MDIGDVAGIGNVNVEETVETLRIQMAAMPAAIEGQSSPYRSFAQNASVDSRTRTLLTLSRDSNDIASFTAGQTPRNCLH